MTRQITPTPFQFDQPLFIKVPFDGAGMSWNRGDHFPWKEMSMDSDRVMILYTNGFLYHNPDLEIKVKVGDGLEALSIEALHEVVESINAKVKARCDSTTEFNKKKCRSSKVKDKQIGLIRSWRRIYNDFED